MKCRIHSVLTVLALGKYIGSKEGLLRLPLMKARAAA
jgi:hypothetical protein